MKVTEDMIRPELRGLGRMYKRLLGGVYVMKRPWPGQRRRSVFVRRRDGTPMRILVIKRGHDGREKRPGLLWLHGGGFSAGMPEMALLSMAAEAARRCVVVSPDYRLSGMAPYPAGLSDCVLALRWMVKNAERLGIDENRILVGGESAGGGLAAGLSLYMRDRGEIRIAAQFPLYPMLDDRGGALYPSVKDNDAPVWSEKQNEKAWRLYLRGLEGKRVPVYAAPGRAKDLSGLPTAVTFVGSAEPFRDETAAYAERLKKAGVTVYFKEFEGCYHAFDMMAPGSKAAAEARAFFREALEQALGPDPAERSKK